MRPTSGEVPLGSGLLLTHSGNAATVGRQLWNRRGLRVIDRVRSKLHLCAQALSDLLRTHDARSRAGFRHRRRHDGAVRLGSVAVRPGGGDRAACGVIVGVVPPIRPSKASATISSSSLAARSWSARRSRARASSSGLRAGSALISPTINRQIVALVGSVTVLSAFVKNVGALAMLMPIAFQLARRSGTSPSSLLMPMSFGALLGGIVTLVGTSPNIIVSRVREQLLGQPFNMFDFTPVGAGMPSRALLFLVFGWRLLPRNRKGSASMDAAFNLEGYTTEVTVPKTLPPPAYGEGAGRPRRGRDRGHHAA